MERENDNELLLGADPIAKELFGEADVPAVRRTRRWLRLGVLRARKLGNHFAITRRDLREQVATKQADQA